MVGSIERLLIKSWAGVANEPNGVSCILIDSGMDPTWPSSGAVLQCERPSQPDRLIYVADTPLPGEPRKLLCGKLRPVVGHHFLRDAMPCEDGLLPCWTWWASFQIQNTFYKQAMLIVKFKQISCDILPWAIGTLMFRAGGMIETISSIWLFIPGQNMTPFARFSTSPCRPYVDSLHHFLYNR